MHRADLLGMLVDRLPAGIVQTGHRCVGFEQDDEQATVIFANGARATADVVVGADGIHSALQPYVVEPSRADILGLGGVSRRDPGGERRLAGRARCATGWAPASASWSIPCGPASCSTTSASCPTDEQMKESWSAPGDPAELAREFAGWDPMVEAVLAQVRPASAGASTTASRCRPGPGDA